MFSVSVRRAAALADAASRTGRAAAGRRLLLLLELLLRLDHLLGLLRVDLLAVLPVGLLLLTCGSAAAGRAAAAPGAEPHGSVCCCCILRLLRLELAGLGLGDERLDDVGGDGEADADVAALGAVLLPVWICGVHADHLPVGVEQRAARVAGVQRGVGLDGAGDGRAVGRLEVALQRGDDPGRERVVEPEGVADRVVGSPTLTFEESPSVRVGRFLPSTLSSARSREGSAPTTGRPAPCRWCRP